MAPEGLEHHPDLRQTPAEERSPGIGPQPQAIADSGRQGHHILEGTGRFRADRVTVGVKAQVRRSQCSLKAAGQVAIVAGDHTRRRQTALQLIRQIRARENGRRRLGKLLPPQLARGAEPLEVDPLAAGEQGQSGRPGPRQGGGQGTDGGHRDRHHHEVGIPQEGLWGAAVTA